MVSLIINMFSLMRRLILWFVLRIFLLLILLFGTLVTYFFFQMPSMEELLDARDRGSVTLLDKNGDVFAWRGKQFEGSLRSETVSPLLKKAIISVEDRGFFKHFGISPRGILGAIRINLKEGRGPFQGHGGSTITQQVAKLLCLLQYENKNEAECRKATMARKFMEMSEKVTEDTRSKANELIAEIESKLEEGNATRAQSLSEKLTKPLFIHVQRV